MKIFITGGTGFIGIHLINRLLINDHDVIVLKREQRQIPKQLLGKKITWFDGELGIGELLKIPDCDVLIHLAASGVKSSTRDWDQCIKSNIIGLNELISSVNNLEIKPVIFYPMSFYENLQNDLTLIGNNPYVITKIISTKIVESWVKNSNNNINIIFGTIYQVYGPYDNHNNVLTYIKDCFMKNIPAKLGSNKIKRDWIYIDDLIDGIIKSFSVHQKGISRFDFGIGELHSLEKVANTFAEIMGKSNDLLQFNSIPDKYDTRIENCAKDFLPNWSPKFSIKKGLDDFYKKINLKG